jgi:hypothetical protein
LYYLLAKYAKYPLLTWTRQVVTVLWLAAVVSFTILTSSSSYYIIAIYGVCALFPALGFIAAHRRSAPLLILVCLSVMFIAPSMFHLFFDSIYRTLALSLRMYSLPLLLSLWLLVSTS